MGPCSRHDVPGYVQSSLRDWKRAKSAPNAFVHGLPAHAFALKPLRYPRKTLRGYGRCLA